MTTGNQDNLRLGVEAARNGQKEQARVYLKAVLSQEANNIPALFWLAFVAPTPQASIRLLEHVLTLDPANEHAQAGLRWARQQLAAGETAPAKAADPQHAQTSLPDPAHQEEGPAETPDAFIREQILSRRDMQKQAQRGALAHRARRTIDPLLTILIILSAAALLTASIWLLALAPADTLAAWLPAPVERVIAGNGAVSSLPQTNNVPTSPAEISIAGPAYASDSDTITLPQNRPIEIELDVAPEDEALISVTEQPMVEAVGPAIESNVLSIPPVVDISPPEDFIGPAIDMLTGVRLFEPVDELLLYHRPASPDEKWIEVNVTEQRVTAWEGNVPVMSFLTSTGLPNTPTVLGEYNIYWKLDKTFMTGPGYYLPDVPHTMYFYAGYALHGAYWHNNFGSPMSHGCVNLSLDNAKELFEWADPIVPPGQTQVTATRDNPGTLVVVHQ